MIKSKKPPDKIITNKCSLDKILIESNFKPILFDVCFRTNQIVIHTYQFLRLWLLHKYKNNLDIPLINFNTLKMTFCALTINDKGGNKPQGDNLKLLEEFEKFYQEHYKNLNYENKINGSYLSQILNSMATDMIINIENNIRLHFFKYVNRFVNSSFKKQNNDLVEKAEKGKKTEIRKQLNKEVYEIKQDLLNNTLNSNSKYHNWINTHRNNIFYKDFVNSYEFDVENNPQKYLKSMIYMCLELEKLETKSFQFFPLRTDIIVKYVPIDSKSIIEIFVKKDKGKILSNIEKYKKKLWSKFVKLDEPIFTQSNYQFDYKIYTDCYSVSIQMLRKDNVESENKKKLNKKNKKSKLKEATKDMNEEQKKEYKMKLEEEQKKKEIEFKLKLKEKKDKEKEEFKKLPKEQQKEIIEKRKKEQLEKKIENKIERAYIDDLTDIQLKELDTNNWCVIDPGINSILTMKNKKGKRYRYSNRKRAKITKRLKYQRLIKNYKDKNDITKVENELSNYSSKTCDFEKFKNFISNKNRINSLLFEKYNKEIFRKYKWYGYLNRKHADTKLVKEIKKEFGKDAIICYGDASVGKGCCKKGNISTPNIAIKRLIQNNFKMYNLDEFRTSKLHYITEEPCDNLYIMDNNEDETKRKERKLHSVLTFKMENKQSGCINRDENAVNNMIKIVNHHIKFKERPLRYKRSFNLIKDNNPTDIKIIKQMINN